MIPFSPLPSLALSTHLQDTTFEQLKLTNSLFQIVIAKRFDEISTTDQFDVNLYSEKIYIGEFMKRWGQLLDSKKFNRTQQIFDTMKSENSFISKHYTIWNRVLGIEEPRFSLSEFGGFVKNQALQGFLKSEENALLKIKASSDPSELEIIKITEARVLRILEITNIYILTNSQDSDLA